ncbi:MAG: SDR family oxidoreductase [Rhodobacteraceae bacterium]|nr:3-oxoacyl-ACP reductase [Paracoccaceae bacterium]MBC8409645.1 SDR family oxidoreductase [Paracoccaceae bacterium]MBT4776831.1 SDR family oxidoreductase [Paracoccaceae bacterium]MBT6437426.1 SDR family oxidoreductase [Paracoccaceae bacterium]
MSLMKKIVLVTGGGSGVGRSAALALLKAGYQVVIAGRRQETLDETLALAVNVDGQDSGCLVSIQSDVSDPDSVEALFAEIKTKFGRIDVLFNNAGVNVPSTVFGDLTYTEWKDTVDVNLTGVFLCARAAFNLMRSQKPQGGRIINNGSISAHVPRPGSAPYTSTKHGVNGLTKTIALDGRPYNIACGQIDIGNALTPMAARMVQGVPQADLSIKAEPVMDVEHIGDAIVTMADLPLETNILSMTIMASKMPYVGRG